ncbi:MAG: glycosyltransferase family 39 protein [Candidatus Micrarchaeales archaeon]
MYSLGTLEYLLTLGMLIAFVGFIISLILGRDQITKELSQFKIKRKHILAVILIAAIFLFIESYVVQPTQLLYFDDDIYQAMALSILHTGQAWMCNYGTPSSCTIGQLFLEPIGESFNIAVGFALFGISRNVTYAVQLALSTIAVIAIFFSSLLLLKNIRAALFSELLLALSPALLVWAHPTTSDLPMLTYSLIALFFLVLFVRRKNLKTFSMLAFSTALVSYMKVNAILFIAVMFMGYFILDYKNLSKSTKENMKVLRAGYSSTIALLILLLFVISVTPEMIYSSSQYSGGSYLYPGSLVPNSCNPSSTGLTANSSINLKNFEYNLCANVYFWFDNYQDQYVMQPIFFTMLAILGAALMLFKKRRELAFLAIWLIAFFVIYTAFYAGSVVFGINWRFMLSLIAPASILGGYACAYIVDFTESIYKKLTSHSNYLKNSRYIGLIAALVLLFFISYSIYLLIPQIGVNPSNLPQAGDARYYEDFVLNQSSAIPSNCIVYSYDPTLFFLVNRSALQMSYLSNQSVFSDVSKQYSCQVIDYGYWCYTPNNFCPSLNSKFDLKPIVTTTYSPLGKIFGFYYISNASAGK